MLGRNPLRWRTLVTIVVGMNAWSCPARADDQQLQAVYARYDALYESGRFDEAEGVMKRLMAMTESSSGAIRGSLRNIYGNLLLALKRPDDAIAMHRQAARIWEAAGDFSGVLRSQLGIADVYRKTDRLDQAEAELRESVQLCQQRGDRKTLAMACALLGELYRQRGKYAEAEAQYKETILVESQVFGADSADVAESMVNLAGVHDDQGRFREATAECERAVALFKAKLGPHHPKVGLALESLAAVHLHSARYADGVRALREALAIAEKQFGPNHPNTARSLQKLGGMLREQRAFADAELALNRSLEILSSAPGNELLRARALNALGNINYDQGRFSQAEDNYRQAGALYERASGPESADVALAAYQVGIACKNQDDFDDAERFYQQSLRLYEKLRGPDHPDVAFVLNVLAALREKQGRIDEAVELYQRAIKIRETAQGPEHPELAAAVFNLGALCVDQGKLAEAGPLLDRALRIQEAAGVDAGATVNQNFYRAKLDWKLGNRQQAIARLNQALLAVEQERGRSSGSEQLRSESFVGFGEYYGTMIEWQRDLRHPAEAFAVAERCKARTLVDQIAASHVDLLAGMPEEQARRLRNDEAQALAEMHELEARSNAESQDQSAKPADRARRAEQLSAQMDEARGKWIAAYTAVRNASPAYRQAISRDFQPATLDEVNRWARETRSLVLHYSVDKACFVFVIDGGDPIAIEQLLVDEQQAKTLGIEPGELSLEKLYKALVRQEPSVLQQISNPHTGRRAIPKLAALYQLLIPAPCREKLISGAYRQLVVVPDGPLPHLPFETLVVEASDEPVYLLDKGPAVANAPSATVLLNLARKGVEPVAGNLKLLTVGNPDYTAPAALNAVPMNANGADTSGQRFGRVATSLQPLPFSGRESSWVAEVFETEGFAVQRLTGRAASEANVRSQISGCTIVHLACHGLADDNYGNFFGALALAPTARSASPKDDGYLSLTELYELDLSGCELAILSACETNFGPAHRGEGVWALTRGLIVAGSRRVVASNWLVDDEAAATLISLLSSGGAKTASGKDSANNYAQALHAAKLQVRRDQRWSSPYYWAGFELIGPP